MSSSIDPLGGNVPRAGEILPGGGRDDVAGEELEALFATMLVKELRRALPEGFFGKGAGADTYEAWLDEHLGRAIADAGALDLAGRVKSALNNQPSGETQE